MPLGDKRRCVLDLFMKRYAFVLLLPCLLCAEEKKPTPEPDYVRWVDSAETESLQTAITRFTDPQGRTVDLVGAVHIADKAYYESLNKRFKTYDAVLYELVGGPMPVTKEDKAARLKKKQTSNLAWVGKMQETMQRTLELSSQMNEVDYSPANFVHADVTLEQFDSLKQKKNESFLGLMMKAWMVQSDLQDEGKAAKEPDLPKLMAILLSGDSATELKRMLGAEFDMVEDLVAGIEGGEGSAIIAERNKVALEVLQQQLKTGKRKLSIFYGAAHLADMEKRLHSVGWKKTGTEWLKAWDLSEKE